MCETEQKFPILQLLQSSRNGINNVHDSENSIIYIGCCSGIHDRGKSSVLLLDEKYKPGGLLLQHYQVKRRKDPSMKRLSHENLSSYLLPERKPAIRVTDEPSRQPQEHRNFVHFYLFCEG